jgi:hypothetical protein
MAGNLSHCDERLLIQRFFTESTLLFWIYGLNSHKIAENTAFSYIIDIIPPCTDKYALFIVQCSIIGY